MLLEQRIRICTKCKLHKTRKNAVPGEGSKKADIVLIGEAPGETEDNEGRPFVGACGRFLRNMLELAQFPMERLYYTSQTSLSADRQTIGHQLRARFLGVTHGRKKS